MSQPDRRKSDFLTITSLIQAALLLALPVAIILGSGLVLGFYFLDREVDARITDRARVTQRLAAVDRISCRRDRHLRNAVVDVLITARDAYRADPVERAAAAVFYNNAINSLPPVKCPPDPGRVP